MGSMKFRSIQQIKNEIVKAIDSSQEIKRYLTYLTDSPLASRGKLDNGQLINQPDITESLVGKNILPMMYLEDVLEDNRCLLFVYPYTGDLSTKTLGTQRLNIDIVIPSKKEILEDLELLRSFEISNLICDKLDGVKLNKGATNLIFTSYVYERVSKDAEYIALGINCEISTSNMRVR